MYIYIPKQNKKYAVGLCALMYVIAAVSLLVGQVRTPRLLWQLIGIAALTVGIQFTTRYVLTEYRYILSDLALLHEANELKVEQVRGKNRKLVCSLSLDTRIALVKYTSMSALEAEYGRISRTFNFSPNISSDNRYAYVFEFNGATNLLLLDCDDEFVRQYKLRTESDMI